VLGGYQGTVMAARRDWAVSNADTVVAFIRGYQQGLAWLRAPANKAAALDILIAEIPDTTPTLAEQNYALLVADPHGLDADGKIDDAGAKRVLELRRRYGPQGKPAADIGHFIDQSYFERAAQR
jgi:ABC-type nitrate/sulfonate/bicarbonate transport system substrate-binding protein